MNTVAGSTSIPKHLAIIMDGNGRWAKSRGRERFYGHIKGARVARQTVEECARLKIPFLTLYAFSAENWSRPESEIAFLMRLLLRYILRERKSLHENNIVFRCIGQRHRLSETILKEIETTELMTANNSGMVLTFALSYGGRQEIVEAIRTIATKVQSGLLEPGEIEADLVQRHLQTFPCPDPDLLIRTSGEWRLSNFLPWQMVYTELYFSNLFWPDFNKEALMDALNHFAHRERRFGKVVKNNTPSLHEPTLN